MKRAHNHATTEEAAFQVWDTGGLPLARVRVSSSGTAVDTHMPGLFEAWLRGDENHPGAERFRSLDDARADFEEYFGPWFHVTLSSRNSDSRPGS